MNRRNFISLFSAVPASLVAAKTIASIPKSEKQIQLLEPKNIISSTNEVYISTKIIKWMEIQYNDNFYPNMIDGIITKDIKAEIYIEDKNNHPIIYSDDNDYNFALKDLQKIRFMIPELQHEIYLIHSYKINASYNSYVTAEIEAGRILQ